MMAAPDGLLPALRRLGRSVPGQILVNTAVFTLPEELRIRREWRLLELGCGQASALRLLAHRSNLREPPVGLDPARDLLAHGQRDMEAEGGPLVRLVQGRLTALPFAEGTFDLLLSGYTFKELADDELRACLKEARRVLKPGGLFLAWEFGPTASARLDRWNRWLLAREGSPVRLRGYLELRAAARVSGFDWVERARLRPFLFPPIPRVSLIMGKAPEGWPGPMSGAPAREETSAIE